MVTLIQYSTKEASVDHFSYNIQMNSDKNRMFNRKLELFKQQMLGPIRTFDVDELLRKCIFAQRGAV